MPAPDYLYLGYSPNELANSPFAAFFDPNLAALSEPVREALLSGPVAHELMEPVHRAIDLQQPGYQSVETGYSISPDGAGRVNVLTPMPGVTPVMWAWWFGWHGDQALKYKLWHPKAHVHVAWADGRGDIGEYIGRTSQVVEYIGATSMALTIRFVAPASLGLDPQRLAATGEVAICARGGIANTPIETGWLVHHLRPTKDGCEMRSRFWLAGQNIRPRGMPGPVGAMIGGTLSRFNRFGPDQAHDLLVHCAQEMSHLAARLPAIYAQFGPSSPKAKS